ncbi:MAG TPA: alpha/beta fold hydrolase [Solirubrobacteraceae bacterium]|nr:alpha/beta fold hydrolase [Solirubrobacteraceae bacterium]
MSRPGPTGPRAECRAEGNRARHGVRRWLTVVALACTDAGAGPCVVLLHGHPFDRSLWSPQVRGLATRFRVVAPDLRGFGESPVTPGCVALPDYAGDVEELLDRLGVAHAALIGLSMGGLVAMELATANPSRWWALGLVATTAEPVTPQEQRVRRERADQVERYGIQVLVDYMHTGLYGSRATPAVRDFVDRMMAQAPAQGAAAALRGRAERPDYRPRLKALDLPTLVCTGSEDPWSHAAVTAEIVAHLQRPDTLLIEGAGHLPNLEAEPVFTAALSDFLSRHAPARSGPREDEGQPGTGV